MIIEGICSAFFLLAKFLISCFPKFPSFGDLNVSLAPIFYVIKFLNQFISIPLVGRCCIVILIVYNIKFAWSIVMWLIRKIPGVS